MPPNRLPLTDLTPADQLLFELCHRGGPRLDQVQRFRGVNASALFHGLIARSVRHGVQGLALANLERVLAGFETLGEFREQTRASLSLITRQAAFWDLEQDRVLGGMARAGFQPVVLKGGALRRWVYKTPVERTMGDLDILVRAQDVPEVLVILGALGYRSEYTEAAREGFKAHLYHDRVTHAKGFHVEVHWALTRVGAPFQLDYELFLARTHILQRPGAPELRVPSAEDMILHTVSQIETDGVRQFRRLVDLDRVICTQQVDWGYVTRQAEKAKLYAHLCVSHRLANLLLGTPAPEELLDARRLSWISRKAIASMRPVRHLVLEGKRSWIADDTLLRLWCLPGSGARIGLLWKLARGVRDPLEWVWQEADQPVERPNVVGGFRVTLTLIARQLMIVLFSFWRPLVPGGRFALLFWKSKAWPARRRPRAVSDPFLDAHAGLPREIPGRLMNER